jgi:hypothetical protein
MPSLYQIIATPMTHSLPYTIAYYALMLTFSPAWAVFHARGFNDLVEGAFIGLSTLGLFGFGVQTKTSRIVLIIMLVVGNICAYTFGGYG